MEKASITLRVPKTAQAGLNIKRGLLFRQMAHNFCKTITVMLCFMIGSCDEPYVPKEQRLSFAECQEMFLKLQAFVRETYLQSDNNVTEISVIANSWEQSEIGKRQQEFENSLEICAYKQFTSEKTGEYSGPSYEQSYAALKTISISVQEFRADIKTNRSEELKARLKLIESMAIKITQAGNS